MVECSTDVTQKTTDYHVGANSEDPGAHENSNEIFTAPLFPVSPLMVAETIKMFERFEKGHADDTLCNFRQDAGYVYAPIIHRIESVLALI